MIGALGAATLLRTRQQVRFNIQYNAKTDRASRPIGPCQRINNADAL